MPLYYIDGYNVIYHSSLLKPIALRDFEAARDALVEKVAAFCATTGSQAKIVFDGRGRPSAPVAPISGVPGLEVLYSHGDKSADAVIERIVYSASNARDLIVVSGDHGIRSFCQSQGALVMAPENFIASVRERLAHTQATLEHLKRPDTQQRLENRLDDATLERLRKLRKTLGE